MIAEMLQLGLLQQSSPLAFCCIYMAISSFNIQSICLTPGEAEGSCHLSKLDQAFDKISAPLIAEARCALPTHRRLKKIKHRDCHPLHI